MNSEALLSYFIVTFLLCASPGPNMLHMMATGARFGLRRTLAAMAGCLLAGLVPIAVSVIGLDTYLHAWPGGFTLLRYIGAAYLAYLGVRLWTDPLFSPLNMDNEEAFPITTRGKIVSV